jgi:hypothetical protein
MRSPTRRTRIDLKIETLISRRGYWNRQIIDVGQSPILAWRKLLGKHHHIPAIERALPMERIVRAFEERFDDPYLNPAAELTFEELTAALPDIPKDELEEGLSHWTSHSGEKTLQTKTVETDGHESRVWYIHGLTRHRIDTSTSSSGHVALG